MSSKPNIVGIVNVTPDSFSDGGNYLRAERAIEQARRLVEQGADWIEIGGDSTRPGSECVALEEEWARVAPVLEGCKGFARISIDTHRAEVARRACRLGATMINDISAGSDKEIFRVVAETNAQFVLMHSSHSTPHRFDGNIEPGRVVQHVLERLRDIIRTAKDSGVEDGQLILDTGMGGFLGREAETSWEVMRNYDMFVQLGFPLMFACSRKSFLGGDDRQMRDGASALCSIMIAQKVGGKVPLYLRVHNVAIHRSFLEIAERMLPPVQRQ